MENDGRTQLGTHHDEHLCPGIWYERVRTDYGGELYGYQHLALQSIRVFSAAEIETHFSHPVGSFCCMQSSRFLEK